MDSYEKDAFAIGSHLVAGVDEAGRGPLAGPVVAAAVIFSPALLHLEIKDSKKLSPSSPSRRELKALDIYRKALAVGIGLVWPEEVDSINIHRATLKAMEKAVKALAPLP
jgi:ribonuclease HII